MTREEAIEYWEGLRKTFSSQLEKEENYFGRMRLQTTIDAIDMAISALRQQEHPQWISVKDRLPEMGEHYQSEDVLVCIDYRPDDPDTTEDTYVSIDHVAFNCFGQGGFSCERDDPRDGEPSPYFVTHWMPLPEPPEEDDHA